MLLATHGALPGARGIPTLFSAVVEYREWWGAAKPLTWGFQTEAAMRASSMGWCSLVLGVLVTSGASVASAQICASVPDGSAIGVYTAACPMGSNVIIGTGAANVINGTAGADCIIALGGNDRITAGGGNDCIYGGPGADIVDGEDDDDTIWGGGSADTLSGNDGADYIDGEAGTDIILGGAGNDTLFGSGEADTIFGEGGDDTMDGGTGADELYGDYDPVDPIVGDEGNDTVTGGTGGDQLLGGPGSDVLSGGDDNDIIDGGTGDDTINGEGAIDMLTGGTGADIIDGGDGGDTINGGDDNDTLNGGTGTGTDIINGDDGDDTIDGGQGPDVLSGGVGADDIQGGTGDDMIFGGDDDDVLRGGTGDDSIFGGDGNDDIFGDDDNDTLNGEAGDDTIDGGASGDIISGGVDNDEIVGGTGDDTINGDDGQDRLFGDAGADTMFGDAGNDLLYGGADADQLQGGTGNDTLHGETGNDDLFGDAGRDNLFGGVGQDDLDGGAEDDYCNSGDQQVIGMDTTGTGVTSAPAPDGDTFTSCEPLLTYAALGTVDGVTVGGRAALRFVTNSEAGTQGFEVFRRDGESLVSVGPALVPALMGAPQGGTYFVADSRLRDGATYRIVEVEVDGQRNDLGEHTVAIAGSASATLRDGVAAVPHALVITPVPTAKAGDAPDGPPVALYLGVGESGIYRVTMTQVAAALELSLTAAQAHLASHGLALTVEGQPVAWWTDAGSDALYFYGESRDSMYLADNLYRLSVGSGVSAGTRDASAATGGEGALSEHLVRAELDVTAVTVMNPDANHDFWFWQYVGRGTHADFPIALASPATAGSAELTIDLHGATTRVDVAGEHSAIVRVNGTQVGTFAFEGIVPRTITLDVDPALLVDGVNTVRITGNGASHSIVWVDAVATRYTRTLDDVGPSVAFAAEGTGAILLEGLTGDSVRVLDVSNPRSPVLLDGLTLEGDSVRLGAEAGARYVAVGSDGALVPRLTVDHASDLRNAAGAEYLVIAPRALFSGATALVDYRSAQGLSTALVDLADVFDEFAHGTPDPRAIRAFLQYASENWATPPRFVVLAGSGSYDYRNIRGLGDNLVPALMVNTANGLFASDSAFADLNDDGRPDVLLGRLPVTSDDALQAFVTRLVAYEAGLEGQTDRTLFLADGSHPAFNTSTDALTVLVNALSDAGLVEQLYRSDLSLELARTRLFEALSDGVFWVNYTGHGALNAMTSDGLLTAVDVASVTAAERAIFTTMTCTTSRFEVPGFQSFGETLSNSDLAIGVWGATGLSAEGLAQRLVQGFARGVYGDAQTLGEAIDGAYGTLTTDDPGADRDMLAIYHLLGDPATRLKDRGPEDIIVPLPDMGVPPTGDAGTMTGDAGTQDLGTGEPPPPGGGNSGCSAGSQADGGVALFGLMLALVGLRVRRRSRCP